LQYPKGIESFSLTINSSTLNEISAKGGTPSTVSARICCLATRRDGAAAESDPQVVVIKTVAFRSRRQGSSFRINQERNHMITLEANYSKKIGLPGYSM
jgi:hypothetical protein